MRYETFSIKLSPNNLLGAEEVIIRYEEKTQFSLHWRDEQCIYSSGFTGLAPWRFDTIKPQHAEWLYRFFYGYLPQLTVNQLEILNSCKRELKKVSDQAYWKEDRSISKNQRVDSLIKSLVNAVLEKLDKAAIAAFRGCEVGDLAYHLSHPQGWYGREEYTETIEIEIFNYGSVPVMGWHGERVNHCDGVEMKNIIRLKAPWTKRFKWSFSTQSVPAWMEGYGDEEPDVLVTTVTIDIVDKP